MSIAKQVLTTKQVLVVRKDLKMRTGKVGAQCAHASMKVLLDLMTKERISEGYNPNEPEVRVNQKWSLWLAHNSPALLWLEGKFAKVTVYVNSEEELEDVYQQAQSAALPCALIIDEGRTEFHGIPTKTVVAIGPEFSDRIDLITGHLPLL